MAKCGMKCEVYSRVVGYYRPIADWNVGKQEEFKDRKTYDTEKMNGDSTEKNATAPEDSAKATGQEEETNDARNRH